MEINPNVRHLFAEGLVTGPEGAGAVRRSHVCYIGNKRGKKRFAVAGASRKRKQVRRVVPAASLEQHPTPELPRMEDDAYVQMLIDQTASEDPAHSTEWRARQLTEEQHWQEKRSTICDAFVATRKIPSSDTLCSGCGTTVASVMCLECPSSYFCHDCDANAHWLQPFHPRCHWTAGYIQPLTASKSVSTAGDQVDFHPVLPLQASRHRCTSCQDMEMEIRPTTQQVIVISTRGRFDLFMPEWVCPECSCVLAAENQDIMRSGFFRASPVQLSTVVHVDIFEMWQTLKHHSPGTSMGAFLAMIQERGTKSGQVHVQSMCNMEFECNILLPQCGPVDQERVAKAYAEWSYLRNDLDRMMGSEHAVCEACGPTPKCVHVDGNFKLYRYRSSGDQETSAYHAGYLIEDDVAVDQHIEKLQNVGKTGNRCGVSTWTAAKNSSTVPSKNTQDETGLAIATCRHSVILGAVNMHRGELFAYGHYLHQHRFRDVQFFASDVVCKYWPWTQRVAVLYPEYSTGDARPYLSVMHATGHAYYCQILYGGIWQEDSGWSVMETSEIANSHMSRAGNTSKYMTAAHRVDFLTDLALRYNKEKHQRMPRLLTKKMEHVRDLVPELEGRLQALLDQHAVSDSEVPTLVAELRTLAQKLSRRDAAKEGQGLENAIEMLSTSIMKHRSDLQRVANSSKRRAKVRIRLSRDKARLRKLLDRLKAETGMEVAQPDVEEGLFPWHVQEAQHQHRDPIALCDQRAICDTFMRLGRLREEVALLEMEADQLLKNMDQALTNCQQSEAIVLEQLQLPDSERGSIVQSSSDAGRYCIQDESRDVLLGLLAVIRGAIAERRHQIQVARDCFSGVFSLGDAAAN